MEVRARRGAPLRRSRAAPDLPCPERPWKDERSGQLTKSNTSLRQQIADKESDYIRHTSQLTIDLDETRRQMAAMHDEIEAQRASMTQKFVVLEAKVASLTHEPLRERR